MISSSIRNAHIPSTSTLLVSAIAVIAEVPEHGISHSTLSSLESLPIHIESDIKSNVDQLCFDCMCVWCMCAVILSTLLKGLGVEASYTTDLAKQ